MKALKTAVIVVGAVALASTGFGLAAGGALGSGIGFLAQGAALATGVGTGALTAGLTAAAALTASSLMSSIMPKPSQGGSQTKWKADPYAGLPYLMGRTLAAGNIVLRRGHGPDNKFQTFVTILSICQAQSIDTTFMNRTTTPFDSGGNAVGTYRNFIYQRTQLGRRPEPAALTSPIATPPGWTSAHKLSGFTASMLTMVYDNKGKGQLTTEPQPSWLGHWVKVYDPAQDSTYPGGSGRCRALDEDTYVWSDNPHLHALTWCLGRWHNGKRVAGLGAPVNAIDVASFVEGRNLNVARGWKLGGQVVTRPDTPWNSLKQMLQAGGAKPVIVGGIITCINQAPRVSLATIRATDIVGQADFSGTQSRRARINGIIPSFRSEAHDWQIVPAKAVMIADYFGMDGGERPRDVVYPLVQDATQASALAAYDILDSREAGPGNIPLGPWWLNYRIGDCVTFQPEPGWSTKVMITASGLDAQTGVVTYGVRTETDAKHPFALGQTGVAPPTASITYDDMVTAPTVEEWELEGVSLQAGGASIPALVISGSVANASADAIIFEYRPFTDGLSGVWLNAGIEPPTAERKEITSVTPGTPYEVAISYRVRGALSERLVLGPVTAGNLAVQSGAATITARSAVTLSSTTTSISIGAFDGTLSTGETVAFPAGTINGLAAGTAHLVFRRRSDGAYFAEPRPALAAMANAVNILIGSMATENTGGGYPGGDPSPPGWGGGGGNYQPEIPQQN